MRRLSDVCLPSKPPKILVADKVRPNEQTTLYMAALGCHFIECSLFMPVIIEVFFLIVRDSLIARTCLYKLSIAMMSRTFSKKLTTRLDLRTSPPVACGKSFDERLIGASSQKVGLLRDLSNKPKSSKSLRNLCVLCGSAVFIYVRSDQQSRD